MPSFDIVSEIDLQEVRNAVDQTNREASTRFDFKGTNATVEFGEKELSLSASTEDRLRALYQLLEEKMVKRSVSLKTLDAGKIEEASHGAARQKIVAQGRDLRRSGQADQQDGQGTRRQELEFLDSR